MMDLESESLPPVVIDASVGLALVRDEPTAARIRRAVEQWADQDRGLYVPSVFWLEILNPLARRYGYSSEDLLRAMDQLEDLSITTIDPDRPLLLFTIDHIERYGLTAFDAHYLGLTTQLGADLATLDSELAAAAGSRAITFAEGHSLHETPAVYEHDVTWPSYKGASAYLARLRAEALAERT
jgi:predicted nucleic acid-binding protein